MTPATRMPTPAWAIALPQALRGRASARLTGSCPRNTRSAMSVTAPPISQAASAQPSRAIGWPPCMAQAIPAASSAKAQANLSRDSAAPRSPRFQASSGPTAAATSSGTTSGTKVSRKKGGPTETLPPPMASSSSG